MQGTKCNLLITDVSTVTLFSTIQCGVVRFVTTGCLGKQKRVAAPVVVVKKFQVAKYAEAWDGFRSVSRSLGHLGFAEFISKNMEIINFPMTGCFDSKTIDLAETIQRAETGTQFKLCLYGSGTVTADATLAFFDVVRSRPKGIGVHIHSHVCLMGPEVLVWLAGDTRTLRADAWIHFQEYPRRWLERSDFQQFVDSLEGREMPAGKTAFQENYLSVERLVKKHLPKHLWNRRVWGGELAEWNILMHPVAVTESVIGGSPMEKKAAAPEPAKAANGTTEKALQ